jgi:hypothetical protein
MRDSGFRVSGFHRVRVSQFGDGWRAIAEQLSQQESWKPLSQHVLTHLMES